MSDMERVLSAFFYFFLIIGIIGLVTGFVCGFVCMNIMKKKGYTDTGVWFCVGCFLNVIGLIVCICLEDKTRRMPQGCEQYPPPYPQYPPYGQPYPNQQYPPQMYTQPAGAQCRSCGTVNIPAAKFCACCGEKLK